MLLLAARKGENCGAVGGAPGRFVLPGLGTPRQIYCLASLGGNQKLPNLKQNQKTEEAQISLFWGAKKCFTFRRDKERQKVFFKS